MIMPWTWIRIVFLMATTSIVLIPFLIGVISFILAMYLGEREKAVR